MDIKQKVAQDLNVKPKQVSAVLNLLEEGCTVPFIARYRKEMTGSLDEEQIREINEVYEYQVNLAKRKEDVIRLIETQGKLSDDLVEAINSCEKLSQVEDIYRPYKQKKKTRASEAIKNGLQPLAEHLLKCPRSLEELQVEKYLNDDIASVEQAWQGAKDIIAEKVSEDIDVRNKIYDSMMNYGFIKTKKKKNAEDEQKIYRMYYDHQEKVKYIANHRVLAINRAEKEKVLTVNIEINEEYLINFVKYRYIKYKNSPCAIYIEEAIIDGLKRLAFPSVEKLVRSELTQKAGDSAIDLFSMNLEHLLMIPPLKNKVILGLDPAYRTGCKLAVIDTNANLIDVDVIYPHKPVAKVVEAKAKTLEIIKKYNVNLIAIGNGTASRESEQFIADLIKENDLDVAYTIVSEAGASVYSASELAIKEFPDLHVEQRSAVSIARRLQDPLSELIKIDPESIGVGQYQHDVDNKQLKQRLSFVVSKCVNKVGVNINQASAKLLSEVSGLTKTMADSIVAYRQQNGAIKNRSEIQKINKIGPKAFQQSAGFLRIENGDNPLDKTALHPESYAVAQQLMEILKIDINDLGQTSTIEKVNQADKNQLLSKVDVDEYTLEDILQAFKQPLRDYRDENNAPILRQDILQFEDVSIGDEFEGVVRNVVDFGAFIDIGLKDDGLVHISNMSEQKIEHPSELLQVGEIVNVKVCKIDEEKHKIQLSML